MQEQGRKKGGIVRLLLSVIFLAGAAWLFLNRQFVYDNFVVWQFKPADEVRALAVESSMTQKAQFYFYASKPEINDRAAFNANCTSSDEQTVVLGCYAAQRIYVFDVDDERLEGIKEVTAAHEMLHAAYERLGSKERERVNLLIEAQLKSVTDERIQKLIAAYERTEPGEKLNELHSIFATEVADISDELEAYYSQYFTDRAGLVKLSQQYEAVFSTIKAQQEALVAELNELAQKINSGTESYNQQTEQFNEDVKTFNAKASGGGYTSVGAFNADRAKLVARQDSLAALRASVDADITLYNQKMKELESINGQAEQLNQSIDSTSLEPAPSI